MILKSYLKKEDITLFEVDLKQKSEGNELQTKNILIKKDDLRVESQLNYTSDICLIQTTFFHEKDVTDVFHIEGEYIKILYLMNGGHPRITHLNNNDTHTSYPGFLKIGYGKNCRLSAEMPGNGPTKYTLVVLSYAYFLNLIQGEDWIEKSELFKNIRNSAPSDGEMNFPVPFPLHYIINEMVQFNWKAKERINYLGLKFKEFLLALYCYEQEKDIVFQDISPEVLSKIKKAHHYLELNFRHTPTIKELCRQVLLNELQLKQGFKKVYGTTIRAHIIDLKMREALNLLQNHKINEIASILDYKSLSHFITTFKKCYGYSPKQFLNKKNDN